MDERSLVYEELWNIPTTREQYHNVFLYFIKPVLKREFNRYLNHASKLNDSKKLIFNSLMSEFITRYEQNLLSKFKKS